MDESGMSALPCVQLGLEIGQVDEITPWLNIER